MFLSLKVGNDKLECTLRHEFFKRAIFEMTVIPVNPVAISRQVEFGASLVLWADHILGEQTLRPGEIIIEIVGRVPIMLESGKEEGVVTVAPVASASSVCVGCGHIFLKSTHDGGGLPMSLLKGSIKPSLVWLDGFFISGSDLSLIYHAQYTAAPWTAYMRQVNFIFINGSFCSLSSCYCGWTYQTVGIG